MDFSQIVAKQRQYFNSGATKPVSTRIVALKKLAAALEAWEPQFQIGRASCRERV